jgi:hypothetical protein
LVAGCASSSKDAAPPDGNKASVAKHETVKATVVSVNRSGRLLGLQDSSGLTWVVQVAPEVRTFDQVQVGDKVVASFTDALVASVVQSGQPAMAASAAVAEAVAGTGTPSAAVGARVTATVKIESVDLEKSVVAFTTSNGEKRAIHVEREEGKKFIQKLKPGDLVDITYTQQVAVSLEKQ